jgi:hypothetical protein
MRNRKTLQDKFHRKFVPRQNHYWVMTYWNWLKFKILGCYYMVEYEVPYHDIKTDGVQ